MGSTYERIYEAIRKLKYNPDSLNRIDDISYMLEELVSDDELSVEEYMQLKSDLDYVKQRIYR